MEHRHAKELFELIEASRAHLRPWMNWADQRRTQADVAMYVANALKQFALNQAVHTGIWEKGKLAGMINCGPIDWPNRAAPLEYWLGAPFQGRGIMTSSCRAMAEHAFGAMNLHRLKIACAEENRRSRAIPEKLGFTFEGVARDAEWLHDHFVNHAIYAMLQGARLNPPAGRLPA
ncbi:MAG TPA: GNAT family protein [Verrucomicrobiae bacterium]|jgi:ribosomal-protein-serine acetyltransferase